ncbi:MAG: dipeptide epimerase [Planctomycetota bacterium]
MLRLTLHPVELPLRHAWTIAHGTRTVQRNLIVALHDDNTGHTGYGEAPAIPYMGVTIDKLLQELDLERGFLGLSHSELSPEKAWKTNDSIEWRGPFATCALDQANHDLYGKIHQQRSHQRLRGDAVRVPASNYTLGMDAPEVMVAKLREYPNFPSYKVKLGRSESEGGLDQDLAVLRRLREETDATFRVDANTAWTAEQTIRLSGPLRDLGVEFIEQPLPPDAPRSEHEAVYFGSDLPVIADESCQTEADVEKCAGLFHGINIKLCKCGGMTPARRMIARAQALDLKVMMGCMTETTVGISALAQFLPLLDYVDMDGALLLAPGSDPADGVTLGPDGVAVFPEGEAGYGNGVTLNRELPTV